MKHDMGQMCARVVPDTFHHVRGESLADLSDLLKVLLVVQENVHPHVCGDSDMLAVALISLHKISCVASKTKDGF